MPTKTNLCSVRFGLVSSGWFGCLVRRRVSDSHSFRATGTSPDGEMTESVVPLWMSCRFSCQSAIVDGAGCCRASCSTADVRAEIRSRVRRILCISASSRSPALSPFPGAATGGLVDPLYLFVASEWPAWRRSSGDCVAIAQSPRRITRARLQVTRPNCFRWGDSGCAPACSGADSAGMCAID